MISVNHKTIGGISIFQPDLNAEIKVRNQVEQITRSVYQPQLYTDTEQIKQIFLSRFKYFESKVTEILPKIACRQFLDIVHFQYDQSAKIEQKSKACALSSDDQKWWDYHGPLFRRTCKFLAEQITLLQIGDYPAITDNQDNFTLTNELWACASQLIDSYTIADEVSMVHPGKVSLILQPPGSFEYLTVKHERESENIEFKQSLRRDRSNKSRYFRTPLDYDIDFIEGILGDSLKSSIGVTFYEAREILDRVIKGVGTTNGAPQPFAHRETIIHNAAHMLGKEPTVIERVLDGFTITKDNMTHEHRQVFKPKQEYRAFRRGFFRVPHTTGDHLAFSKEMAQESLDLLLTSVIFGNFPTEWLTDDVRSALDEIRLKAGKWFEKTTMELLKSHTRLEGKHSWKDGIGQGEDRIEIPANVGEIDIIGYYPTDSLLLIAECKMVSPSYEGRWFQTDLEKFIEGDGSYHAKFQKKIRWITDNLDAVIKALNSSGVFESEVKPTNVASAMITYYPCIAKYFIDEYPCESLINLLQDIEEHGVWPYSHGITSK